VKPFFENLCLVLPEMNVLINYLDMNRAKYQELNEFYEEELQ